MITVTQQVPQFGVNYDIGYVGFICRHSAFVAKGINWFEKWDNISDIPVEHTFGITGDDSTIEAFTTGVAAGKLSTYINDKNVALLVRKPVGWTQDMGSRIVEELQKHVGDSYNYKAIAADSLLGSIAGRWGNIAMHGLLNDFLARLANSQHTEDCSQLMAIALEAQPELQAFGILANPPPTITPMQLFEDTFIFQPGAVELVNKVDFDPGE